MICKACKAGGLLLIEARQAPLPGNRVFLKNLAEDRHGECEHLKTCTCQHRMPVNRGDVIVNG